MSYFFYHDNILFIKLISKKKKRKILKLNLINIFLFKYYFIYDFFIYCNIYIHFYTIYYIIKNYIMKYFHIDRQICRFL